MQQSIAELNLQLEAEKKKSTKEPKIVIPLHENLQGAAHEFEEKEAPVPF